jgi:hypothetical protein
MWYRNFIVFVIFVVVDETISGKVYTRRLSLMILAVLLNPLGLPGLRRSWVNLNVLPPK